MLLSWSPWQTGKEEKGGRLRGRTKEGRKEGTTVVQAKSGSVHKKKGNGEGAGSMSGPSLFMNSPVCVKEMCFLLEETPW